MSPVGLCPQIKLDLRNVWAYPPHMTDLTKRLLMICDPAHPHYPEHGHFTGKVIVPKWGGQMAEVALENCQHGTSGCFVSKGQVRFIAEPKRS